MMLQNTRGGLVVWFSMLLGLLFQLMPVPEVVDASRPDWLLLIMIYWAMALPHRYNILTAWVLGTVLDVLLGSYLGIRSLTFSLVIYVIVLNYQKLRNFSIWQQALIIAFLLLLYHLLIYWMQFVIFRSEFQVQQLLPVLSGTVIWPWIYWLLRRLRRRYKVK
ncbi:MAG: rod shape-determining protein MreD [Shewanella fodinae]|jgi:rod shape-determining protein MreD|uniref:rod shape-determining protein MreD n=1 Tax=Shewanella fodinae TaxID=552357 RepID=UPI00167951AA|nr:rod shape-determining protein MreD [Shewanella fodinae]MCD8476023.1 rod shape-determining protein MreD [Shewanella fodinae]MCL2907380.1 rod shape-determining protein MreD [Shewanella fodinae]GGY93964.1 rod shape-determining protein MreD [Shewanella fodinae]